MSEFCSVEQIGDVTVITLLERQLFELSLIEQLRTRMNELIDEGHYRLVVDFQRVEMISTAIINVLLLAHKKCVIDGPLDAQPKSKLIHQLCW